MINIAQTSLRRRAGSAGAQSEVAAKVGRQAGSGDPDQHANGPGVRLVLWLVVDEEDDWYYWFTADVVIVDETWIIDGEGKAVTLWDIEGQASAPRCGHLR